MPIAEAMTPAPEGVWREVLGEDPGATINQTPEWARAVRRATRAVDASRLYVLEDGRRLVLPMMRRSPIPGLVLEDSYPYGDLLATGGLRATDVTLVLDDLLRRGRAARTRLLTGHVNSDQWESGRAAGVVRVARHVHVLDLGDGFESVWGRSFHRSARKAVRKAESSGLEVQRDASGELASTFYAVYQAWTEERARESGMPRWLAERAVAGRRETLELFEAVASELGESCRQWVAWHAGQPVAALIVLHHREHAIAWRGYSRKALAGPLRANNLLHKAAIEDACRAGCRSYSFGQSGGTAGLERFKETLGAIPRPAAEYRIDRLPLGRLEELKTRVLAGAATLGSSARSRRTSPAGPSS